LWFGDFNKKDMSIFLVTPTGARKDQFALCAKWMQRQTYSGEVVWIIVDDAYPYTTDNVGEGFKDKWTIVRIHPSPLWAGENTQSRNIKAGIDFIKETYPKEQVSAIFIIEDDDYYKPHYLQRMMDLKGTFDLWGETNTIYYNVNYRRFADNNNKAHASLFQTAFTYDAIPVLEGSYNNRFIDCVFWANVRNRFLFYDNTLAIGIKGMPGRGGIGAGHTKAMGMISDISLVNLHAMIGEDYKEYERYYNDQPITPLFR
jgi:hypothetical protein